MGDKKVDILAEYNERESQVVKWSAYSRNELSEVAPRSAKLRNRNQLRGEKLKKTRPSSGPCVS